MSDDPRQVAFDLGADPAERRDATAELSARHRPLASELLPAENIKPVIDYIRGEYEDQRMAKAAAQIIQFPGRSQDKKDRGSQSVMLDNMQVFAHGDYFDKPSPVGYEALRAMVEQTPVLNAVIMQRIRQVQRFANPQDDTGPGFVIRHIDRNHSPSKKEQESIQLLQKFIQHNGWEFNPRRRKMLKRDNFSQFLSKLVRESLTYDAAPIETELKRNRKEGIDGFYALDGSTIRLCTDEGYQGDDERFAVQVVSGRVVTAYSHEDLIYEPRNPRADVRLAGYGLGETELLVRVVTGWLNAMTYNARGFDSNAIPKGILNLVGEYSQEDLAAFKRYWNAMVKGVNNAWTLPMLVSSTPEGKATYERLDSGFSEMLFARWMTFLTSIICAIYGMSPAEINFDSFTASNSSPLSGSDTAEKLASSHDSGLRPLLSYLESTISDFIIADFSDHYVFRWAGLDEEDAQQRLELRKAALTYNELRAQEDLPPIDSPIGESPINPTLAPIWMQLQAQAQAEPEEGSPGADDEQQGDAEPAAEDEQGDAPEAAQDEPEQGEPEQTKPDEPEEPDHGATAQALEAQLMRKAGGFGSVIPDIW